MQIRGLTLFCLLVFANLTFAQDIQFSQYYNVPLYLNPAFAGSAHNHRAVLHQRLQWPKLDAKYTTSLFSFDTYIEKYNSSVGIIAYQDYQGNNTIKSSEIGLMYSYELNLTGNITVRPGMQLSYVTRNTDYSSLMFSYQFDNNGLHTTNNGLGGNRIHYADVSAGTVVYSDNLFLSFSGHHLNMPNQAFIQDVSRLPIKYSVFGGYRIKITSDNGYHDNDHTLILTPTFHYKTQGKSDQLDLGLYAMYDHLLIGFWYRGLHGIKQYERKLQNNEAIIGMIGYQYNNLAFAYSYDYTVSRLAIARTGGAHEINLTWLYKKKYKKNKMRRRLPCPNFYKV
ncbi:MAG: type IX secretion system membrane protein PorP/SprF [Cytophagaceae bacterium]